MNKNTPDRWLQDLLGYGTMAYQRFLVPVLGRGIDHRQTRGSDQARALVSALHPRHMALQVREVLAETPSTTTLRLARTDGELPPFRPGQYVNLHVEIDGVRTSRPYSISSAPGADHYDVTVRDYPGGFVAPHLVKTIRVGDRLTSSGPAGSFYHEPLLDGSRLVLLAGGSGITPMMSMIRDQARRGWPLKVQLLYGSRDPGDVIFDEELSRLAASTDRFQYDRIISEPPAGYDGLTGLLDADLISQRVDALSDKTFYICGPGAFYDLCQGALLELGVLRQRIKRELYGPPADITADPGWPAGLSARQTFGVRVKLSTAGNGSAPTREIEVRAGEPLMNALERCHLVVPALCRTGECSACRTKLLAGRVLMPEHTLLRVSDRRNGYIHPCVAYPLEDLELVMPTSDG